MAGKKDSTTMRVEISKIGNTVSSSRYRVAVEKYRRIPCVLLSYLSVFTAWKY